MTTTELLDWYEQIRGVMQMRHIDDLRFEIEALKDHATRSSNETLMASACFMADTLNSLERFLTQEVK